MARGLIIFVAVLAVASASAQSRPALRRDQASVQFMITHGMKEQLRELGYSAAEIAALQPERAAAIIDNKIRCPSQGMPATWKRSGGGKGGSPVQQVFEKAATIAAVGLATALGLHFFTDVDLGEFGRHIASVLRILLGSTSPSGGRRY